MSSDDEGGYPGSHKWRKLVAEAGAPEVAQNGELLLWGVRTVEQLDLKLEEAFDRYLDAYGVREPDTACCRYEACRFVSLAQEFVVALERAPHLKAHEGFDIVVKAHDFFYGETHNMARIWETKVLEMLKRMWILSLDRKYNELRELYELVVEYLV